MADYSKIGILVNGILRQIELNATGNVLVVRQIDVRDGSGADPKSLTHALMTSLVATAADGGFASVNYLAGYVPNTQKGAINGVATLDGSGTLTAAQIPSSLSGHIDGGASKHDANEIDYERADGSKKNILAASDDVESALSNLDDAIGTLDATPTNYTPTSATVGGHLEGIDTAMVGAGGYLVKVSAADTTAGYLNTSITAGSGLSKSITNPGADEVLDLAVNVDGSTLEIDTDALRIKDLGVTTAKIAAAAITDAKLASDSVTTVKILDSNVTTAKIADSNVTTAKIADSNVTTAKIADSNVTAAKLASDSVTTVKILDSNVTTAKIADAAITDVKLASSSVTTAKIADSNVTTAKIADSNVTADKLAADSVTTAKIADSNVTTAKIASSAVTNDKIATGIDATKIADGSVTSTEFQYINSLTSNAQTQITNNATAISDHLSDTSDAHDASAISSVPAGNLVATDVQAALNELDSEKVAKSGDTMSGNLAMGSNKITGLAAGTAAGDAVRYEQAILASGVNAFSAAQSMGGFKLTSVADGTSSSDAINKGQLDAALNGLKPKLAARAATTANITIATALNSGDVIDGVTLADGDRVLVKDQSTASQNGIYIVGATPSRATDFDSVSPIDEINGAMVPIEEGTTNAGKIFVQSGAAIVTVGTDPISFVYFNSTSNLTGDDGITISGVSVSVDHDGQGLTFSAGQLALELDGSTLSKSASGVKVSASGITTTEIGTAAVTADKLAADSVTTAKILDSNVTAAKLASDSVTTVKILDSNVTTAKIADSNVTTAKIADSNVTAAKLAADSVTTVKILDSNVTTAKIADSNVTTAKIADSNVTTAKIADAAVTSAKLAAAVAGAGLTGGAGSALAVGANADGSITVNADDIQVAYAPSMKMSLIAGEGLSADTTYFVRWALTGETAGRVYKADKDASSTHKFYAFGVVKSASAISAGDPVTVMISGSSTLGSNDTNFASGDVGKPIYLTAAGAFSVTAPTAADEAVFRVGMIQEVSKIYLGQYQLNYIN